MARRRRLLVPLLTLGLTAAALSAQATAEASVLPAPGAKPVVGAPIPLTAQPEQIAAGPDGNMWVSLSGSTDDLAKVTPAGAVTYYDLGGASGLGALTVGPDQNLWATVNTGVVRIPPADPTNETSFAIGGFTDARGIDLGPDGNLWAASGDKVFRIPPANPVGATPFTVPGMGAREVAADANRVWVVDNTGGRVLAFATDGTFTPHAVGGSPQGIAAGPGGQVLYSNPESGAHHAARLTLGGTPQKTPLPATDPSFSVAFGADGAYWVGLFLTREMARITPEGELTRYGTFAAPYLPRFVAAGPGNTIWVSLQDPGNNGAIGVVTGLDVDNTATIKVKGSKAKVKKGKARVRLQCPATEISGPCVGKVKLKALTGKKQKLGAKAYSLVAGKTGTVKVKLGRATLARIGPAGLKVKAIVTVRDSAGNKAKVVKKIKLVR